MKERKITIFLFLFYLALLTWIIVFKLSFSLSELPRLRNLNLVPFEGSVIVNGKIDYTEIINNLIVFVPIGVYLTLLRPKAFFNNCLVIIGISLLFESVQYIFAIGASDMTDLLMNSFGGILGLVICLLMQFILKDKAQRMINRIALICTGLIILLLTIIFLFNT